MFTTIVHICLRFTSHHRFKGTELFGVRSGSESQRRFLRPTNPYVVFAAGKNIKTHQDSHGILKRNHSELRTIQSHQGGNVEKTQNYNAHQEKLAIQNHSEPFGSPSNSRCPLRCRNQRNWTTGVCVIACGLVCRNAATLPVAAVACACSRFGFRVSVAKLPLRT